MANLVDSLKQIVQIPGNICSALVDIETGLSVAQIGDRRFDLSGEAEFYARYMRVNDRIIDKFTFEENIEEIIFTSRLQYHLLYPIKLRILKVRKPENLFFFIAQRREDTNLAQARSRIKQVISEFAI